MPRWRIKWINLYPPFLGAGIRVTHRSPDSREFRVTLKKRWWNKNYVGSQFGGSIYMMCDPFFMLILIENLGEDYLVWDKGASITFEKPATTSLYATFHIPHEQIESIKNEVDHHKKTLVTFYASVIDDEHNTIANVEKVVYIRQRGKFNYPGYGKR